jgi:hypothetical protein
LQNEQVSFRALPEAGHGQKEKGKL